MNAQLKVPEVSASPTTSAQREQWRNDVTPYRNPKLGLSLWQIANTLIPLAITWYLMYLSLSTSYWLTLALTPLAAGCHIRTFIIFHDCGHGSFFKSEWANDTLGFVCGVLTLTPYYHWRHSHAIHHASSGNLGRRVKAEMLPMRMSRYIGTNGNILTLTVKEYSQLTPWEQLVYRVYRHPLILFVFLPTFLFVVLHRFASPTDGKRESRSVLWNNLAMLAVSLILVFNIGLGPFLLVEIPIVVATTTLAVWMFYVQHQYEDTYWEQKPEWDFVSAALDGSSYYKLPALLRWFSGNIGFHHIHHLCPRVPSYYLQKCHQSSELFQQTEAITLGSSLKTIFANLWDEEQRKMVGFAALKASPQNPAE